MLALRLSALAAVLAALATATTAAAFAPPTPALPDATAAGPGFALMTAKGVGPVKLGASFTSLRTKGRVGKLTGGCPLSGVKEYGATLRAPLKGGVTFNAKKRVIAIFATGRVETARHVRVGDTDGKALQRYPGSRYDRASVSDPIPYGVITVLDGSKTRFSFLVSAATRRIVQLDVPRPGFCE